MAKRHSLFLSLLVLPKYEIKPKSENKYKLLEPFLVVWFCIRYRKLSIKPDFQVLEKQRTIDQKSLSGHCVWTGVSVELEWLQ
jgi:hypothetical protein